MVTTRIISSCSRVSSRNLNRNGSTGVSNLKNSNGFSSFSNSSLSITNQKRSSQIRAFSTNKSSSSGQDHQNSTSSGSFIFSSSSFKNSSSSSPLYSISILTLATLTSFFIYHQSQSQIHNEPQLEKPSHSQPDQDEFGDVNAKVLKGEKNMGKEAILTQQEIMRERTTMLGVCGWGSNRYNVVAPDQPQLNVIKNPRWIPYFTGVALRDLILEEKHGVAVDLNGDVLQWGLGFFDPTCRTNAAIPPEVDPLSDPEAVAASFIPFETKRSDRKPISNKESLPNFDPKLNNKALEPKKTLIGKNIIRIHATDTKVFALSKNGDVYVFSAMIDQQQKNLKCGDWNKNPLKLFGLFNGKQIDHEKISNFLTNKDNVRKEGLPRGEKISDIVGGSNHLLGLTNKGRVLSLPTDDRGNLFGQLGSRRTFLNSPSSNGTEKGSLLQVDLEPRMLSNLIETKSSDPTSMLPSWALPPPEVMAKLTAKAEAAAQADSSSILSRSITSSSNSTESLLTSTPIPITEPSPSIRYCTAFREIPSLRGVELIQIASGREHSAGLTPDGKVVAWGRNTHGQIGLGSQVTLECIPTPSEVNLTRSFPSSNSEIKCTKIFLGADNSYFVTSRREGPLKFDSSEEFSGKSKTALSLASGIKIDVLACGKGQWGGLGNAMWSQINGNPTKVKTVSGLMEFSEASLSSHPVPIYDISIGRPGNVALTLDTVEKEGHYAFGRDVMVFGFNAAFNLGNGRRSNLAVPQHLPPLPRQIETTVDQERKSTGSGLNLDHQAAAIEIPLDEKKKQLREADINSGVLTHMPHKRLQLASETHSVTLIPKIYSNDRLNKDENGSEKKKVKVEERILSGASSMAVWFKASF